MAGANGGNTYKSSHSVNNPTGGNNAGSYNAQRNGQRPYNPQANQQQAQQQNQMANQQRAKQLNMAKKQQEQQEDGDGLSQGQQIKKQVAKKTLTEAAKAYNPAVGAAVEKALETKKGDAYLDEFAKGESVQDGVKKVVHKAKEEQRKRNFKIYIATALGPLLFLVLIIAAVFGKNADSQKYANENEGQIDEIEELDNTDTNVFKNYPKMYETVEKYVERVSKETKVPVDKYLILSTLIAPLENGLIVPYEGKCHSDIEEYDKLCYKFIDYNGKEEELGFEKFIEKWSKQSELLAKMQIMNYVNINSDNKSHSKLNKQGKVNCGSVETMEQYAKNDKEVKKRSFLSYLAPWTWGDEYNDKVSAETNVKCVDVPVYKKRNAYVPDVAVLSIDQGVYYSIPKADGTGFDFHKEEDTGGVYFWNLVNQDGFIDIYLPTYLAYDENKSDAENYKNNLHKILEVANYIYSYYESIRKDCDDQEVIDSTIEKIKVTPKGGGDYEEIDFEDQYVGGVLMAEFASGGLEAEKAMAILARTEAVAVVGVEGKGTIENSSKNQNYNGNAYNPTYDPKIGIVEIDTGKKDKDGNPIYTYKGGYDPEWPEKNLKNKVYEAVKSTRGIVISKYIPKFNDSDYYVLHTEYDAFCPQKSEMEDGFYVLPDGQRDLPIKPEAYSSAISGRAFTIPDEYLKCPCFKNKNSMPQDTQQDNKVIKFATSPSVPPTEPDGNPRQGTDSSCWTAESITRENQFTGATEYGWSYRASGGHGRGASQYGLLYFESFGYKWDGLLGLFFNRDDYGIAYRQLYSSIKNASCQNAIIHNKLAVEETVYVIGEDNKKK